MLSIDDWQNDSRVTQLNIKKKIIDIVKTCINKEKKKQISILFTAKLNEK